MIRSRLQLGGDSYALLQSDTPSNTAVIFVHGLWGHSEKTWYQFQTLPDTLSQTGMFPWWKDCDLFFYSYESAGIQILPNVSQLLAFICNIFPEPKWHPLGAADDCPVREYKYLRIVAHSEGAVLVRASVLERVQCIRSATPSDKVREKLAADHILNAKLFLFAPALFGALLCGWKGVLLKFPVFHGLIECCLNSFPAFVQLQPTSPILEQIRADTVSLASKYPDVSALRAWNLFGVKDSVASIGILNTDYPPEYEPSRDHCSVCKPSRAYLRPLAFIRDETYSAAA